MNKTESQLARDSQGRTRRQEMTSNIGPLATNAPKIAFINDPVDKVSYLLDLSDKTAQVIKLPAGALLSLLRAQMPHKPVPPGTGPVTVEKRIIVAGGRSRRRGSSEYG